MAKLRDISVLESNLLDEYYRCERALVVHQREFDNAPFKGYISCKRINGKEYHYLQWREGNKVKSKYLKTDMLENVKKELEHRKMHLRSVRHLKRDMKKLRFILGDDVINGYRDAWV